MTNDQTSLDLTQLIVCPNCDALYRLQKRSLSDSAVCGQCHTVLISPRRKAGMQIIAIALAIVVLLVAAVFLPFLSIHVAGAKNSVSVLDAARSFNTAIYAPLALAVAVVIFVIPLLRAILSIYVLVPIVLERRVFQHAKSAFHLMETLRPWSMAEIFVLGCAVALIKVADLAVIEFGVAFWMFSALVVLIIAQDSFLCRWSVWNSLTHPRKS
jgi:paraquat-inducible protein A